MSKFIRRLPFNNRWSIAIKILPLVILIIFVKYLTNYFGLDRIELNNLFTALISANIFLFGFLVSGVLSDYKEGEKLPGDLAATLESIADEGWIIYQNTKSDIPLKYLTKIDELTQAILDWFNKIRKTDTIKDKIFELNSFFLQFEPLTQPNFIFRLKQEQSQMRKMINRIHTIRETSFLGTGYAIAEIITTLIVGGMLFIKIGDSTYEAMIFTGFVSFVLVYMIFLIKDLDNPFSYYAEDNLSENVSLAPIEKVHARLDKMLKEIG
jgi:hypothetical protein